MQKYRITYKRLQGTKPLDYIHMTIEEREECPQIHEHKVLKDDPTIKEFISNIERVEEPVMIDIDEELVPYNPDNDTAKYFEENESELDIQELQEVLTKLNVKFNKATIENDKNTHIEI